MTFESLELLRKMFEGVSNLPLGVIPDFQFMVIAVLAIVTHHCCDHHPHHLSKPLLLKSTSWTPTLLKQSVRQAMGKRALVHVEKTSGDVQEVADVLGNFSNQWDNGEFRKQISALEPHVRANLQNILPHGFRIDRKA